MMPARSTRPLSRTFAGRLQNALLIGCALGGLMTTLGSRPVLAQRRAPLLDPATISQTGYLLDGQRSGDASGSASHGPSSQAVTAGGGGISGRFGHIIGPALGRDDSITYFEVMPFLFEQETMLFGDFRMYRLNHTNNGLGLGGNAGVGVRHYVPSYNAILGIAGFYDLDDSRGEVFEQAGLSFEILSEFLDVRSNWYLPTGTLTQELGTTLVTGSQRFQDFNIIFDTATQVSTALRGFDTTFTVPVPGEQFERFDTEASAGFYHFQNSDIDTRAWGWRLRGDIDLLDQWVHMFMEFTSDPIYKKNYNFGASVNYYHNTKPRRDRGASQFNRMTEFVRRNFNVVTADTTVINTGILAVNPNTGDPFFVLHVDNANPPDDLTATPGTFENPVEDVPTAFGLPQFPGTSFVFVHANSVFEGELALDDEAVVYGEGGETQIPVIVPGVQNNTLQLPLPGSMADGSMTPGGLPIFQNSAGNALTIADQTSVVGFRFLNPAINGLVGNNIQGGPSGGLNNGIGPRGLPVNEYRNLTFIGDLDGVPTDPADDIDAPATGNGILLTNPTGEFALLNVVVSGFDDDALRIDGGDADINNGFPTTRLADTATSPASLITNADNLAVFVSNTTDGTINLSETAVDDTGDGILIQDANGNFRIGQAALPAPAGAPMGTAGRAASPIDIDGGNIVVTGGTGNAIFGGETTINNSTGPAVRIENRPGGGVAQFINNLTISNRNDEGILISNVADNPLELPTSPLQPDVSFNQVTIVQFQNGDDGAVDGGPDDGIRIQNSSGDVRFNGGVGITGSFVNGINISGSAAQGSATFDAGVTINGASAGALPGTAALLISNDTTDVTFGDSLDIGQHALRGIFINNNTGNIISFADVAIDNQNALNTGALNASGLPSIEILDNSARFLGLMDPDNRTQSTSFSTIDVTHDASNTAAGIATRAAIHIEDNIDLVGGTRTAVNLGDVSVVANETTAIFATDNDVLLSSAGTIDVADAATSRALADDVDPGTDAGETDQEGSAIVIRNTNDLNFNLTQVNSSGTAFRGIHVNIFDADDDLDSLADDDVGDGIFQIFGQQSVTPDATGTLIVQGGSGGTIEDATQEAALFVNGTAVILAGVEYTDNLRGIVSDNVFSFNIDDSEVSDNTGQGLIVLDAKEINVVQTTFANNGDVTGTGNRAQVFILATQPYPDDLTTVDQRFRNVAGATYTYSFLGNSFEEDGGGTFSDLDAMVYIESDISPADDDDDVGAALALEFGADDTIDTFLGNNFDSGRFNGLGLFVDWEGPIGFTPTGIGNIATDVNLLRETPGFNTGSQINNNTFVFDPTVDNSSSTAITLITERRSSIQINNNTITFADPNSDNNNGVVLEFGEDGNTARGTLFMDGNVIVDNGDGGTGFDLEFDGRGFDVGITNNTFLFNNVNATAINLDFDAGFIGNFVNVSNNTFNFNASGGQAIIFDSIADSTVNIDSNTFNFNSVFLGNAQAVQINGSGTITLNGLNNTINAGPSGGLSGAQVFSGTGNFNGTITINGLTFP